MQTHDISIFNMQVHGFKLQSMLHFHVGFDYSCMCFYVIICSANTVSKVLHFNKGKNIWRHHIFDFMNLDRFK